MRASAQPLAARVLIFGGSQGAHAINMAMVEAAACWPAGRRWRSHQTGARPRTVRGLPSGRSTRAWSRFCSRWIAVKSANLVVCRAGATLAELTAAGRPSFSFRCHFTDGTNGRTHGRSSGGAALVMPSQAPGQRLLQTIRSLAMDPDRRQQMGLRSAAARQNRTRHG
jgi:UDP-N-acetylglucosamine--N-acetylmuramyl-(pentapeptide) pyrophosphoryl-undecaprenol N-acetylglucosamine transferase